MQRRTLSQMLRRPLSQARRPAAPPWRSRPPPVAQPDLEAAAGWGRRPPQDLAGALPVRSAAV